MCGSRHFFPVKTRFSRQRCASTRRVSTPRFLIRVPHGPPASQFVEDRRAFAVLCLGSLDQSGSMHRSSSRCSGRAANQVISSTWHARQPHQVVLALPPSSLPSRLTLPNPGHELHTLPVPGVPPQIVSTHRAPQLSTIITVHLRPIALLPCLLSCR